MTGRPTPQKRAWITGIAAMLAYYGAILALILQCG